MKRSRSQDWGSAENKNSYRADLARRTGVVAWHLINQSKPNKEPVTAPASPFDLIHERVCEREWWGLNLAEPQAGVKPLSRNRRDREHLSSLKSRRK